jgi:hypothetical protein
VACFCNLSLKIKSNARSVNLYGQLQCFLLYLLIVWEANISVIQSYRSLSLLLSELPRRCLQTVSSNSTDVFPHYPHWTTQNCVFSELYNLLRCLQFPRKRHSAQDTLSVVLLNPLRLLPSYFLQLHLSDFCYLCCARRVILLPEVIEC